VTLPADSLNEVKRIAHARKVNVSTVIAEALNEGLRTQMTAAQSDQVLESYKKAFSGFSEEQMSILDGIILEPASGR
jgi:post-segregation antitoxin (ccd killing protein)